MPTDAHLLTCSSAHAILCDPAAARFAAALTSVFLGMSGTKGLGFMGDFR